MFWAVSWAILLMALLLSLKPLLGAGNAPRLAVLAALLVLPLAVLVLYRGVGTPEAMNALALDPLPAEEHDMDALTEQLRSRLSEDPEQVQGWILLGRSYKTLQKYPQALEALQTANRLVPNQPLIVVELVEAELFASGNPRVNPGMVARLEQAIAQDPTLQKGLWLLGIAAAQSGDDQRAIGWWQQLAKSLEPGSEIAQTVEQQIALARSRTGREAAATPSPDAGWSGLEVEIELSVAAAEAINSTQPDPVLFVIVRAADSASGPPLGVRRIERPHFPVQLALSDEDSMLPQRPISSAPEVSLQARLSRKGQATASPGDWQSASVRLFIESAGPVRLVLDQPVE